jgi:hypothetical protein
MHQKATTDHVVIVPAQEAREEDIPSSLINSGKLEAVQRDHRKKIGSVRSKS